MPNVLPQSRPIQILEISQDSFPRDLEFPVFLSEPYACVLFDMVIVDVYLIENNLVYTVQVPLVWRSVFIVFKIILFPTQVKEMEWRFTLKEPEKEFIVKTTLKGFVQS